VFYYGLLSAFVSQFKKLIFQFLNNLVNCHIKCHTTINGINNNDSGVGGDNYM